MCGCVVTANMIGQLRFIPLKGYHNCFRPGQHLSISTKAYYKKSKSEKKREILKIFTNSQAC